MERTLTSVNKRKIALTAVKYLFVFAVQTALSLAEVYGIRPFGSGFFAAVTFLGLPAFVTAPLYLAAEAVARADLYSFLSAVICAAVVAVAKIVIIKAPKSRKYVMPTSMLVAGSGLFLMSFAHGYTVLMIIVSVLLTLAFMYAAYVGLRPAIVEKLRYKMLETELVCLAAVLIAAGLGLSRANIYSFPLITFVASLSVYVAARLAGAGTAVIVALCFGLGDALNTYDVSSLATFVFIAAVSGVFLSAPRLLTALSGIVAYVMFTFYFSSDYLQAGWQICALAVGGVVYALIPAGVLVSVKEKVFESHERAAVRFMINKNRADLGSALMSSSHIFDAMSGVLNGGNNKSAEAVGSLEVRCCEFCENKDECKAAGVFSSFGEMAATAASKGHVAVADLPEAVEKKCVHLGKLLSAANDLEERRKNIAVKNECEASARKLMASQLSGVSAAMKNMAIKTGGALPFDRQKEKTVVEELNYCGVSCAQSLIAGESVTLVIRSECLDRKLIEKTVSRLMRSSYKISGIDDTALSGFIALMLEKSPKYDMVFGVAGCPKTAGEKSGDTHSFIKLSSSRFMIALCDGMGSGENAEKLSETAIGLIENFYRAGFDSSLVLKSVNRFLSLNAADGFSAIDIAVVDLETAKADIIKLSTPATYVKKKDVIQKIEGGGLPLGVTETVSPSVTSIDLSSGDMLVMATDGVADCFEGDKLAAAVNNLRTVNPQLMAQGILEHTLANTGGKPRDDSTVIAAKLISI